jgi:hypothetical protein
VTTPLAAGKVGALRVVLYTGRDATPFTVHCDPAQEMPDRVRTAGGEILTKTMDVLTVPRGD